MSDESQPLKHSAGGSIEPETPKDKYSNTPPTRAEQEKIAHPEGPGPAFVLTERDSHHHNEGSLVDGVIRLPEGGLPAPHPEGPADTQTFGQVFSGIFHQASEAVHHLLHPHEQPEPKAKDAKKPGPPAPPPHEHPQPRAEDSKKPAPHEHSPADQHPGKPVPPPPPPPARVSHEAAGQPTGSPEPAPHLPATPHKSGPSPALQTLLTQAQHLAGQLNEGTANHVAAGDPLPHPALEELLSKLGTQPKSAQPALLTWLLLRATYSAPRAVALYDELDLRTALAQTFPSFGEKGDHAWRAAAAVRLLLQIDQTPLPQVLADSAFWQSPDAHWLAGVDPSGDYVNQEAFTELLPILAFPTGAPTKPLADKLTAGQYRIASFKA